MPLKFSSYQAIKFIIKKKKKKGEFNKRIQIFFFSLSLSQFTFLHFLSNQTWSTSQISQRKRERIEYFWDSFFQESSRAVADWTWSSIGNYGARRSSLNWSEESKAKVSCASPFNLGREFKFCSSLDLLYSSIAFICSLAQLYASSHSFFVVSTTSTTLSIQI